MREREIERDRDESMWLCDVSLHHFRVWWVCVNMSNYRETISESYGLLCVRCIASYLSVCEALSSVPGPQQGWQSCKLIRHMCPVTVRFDRFSGWWSFCGSLFMLLPQPLPEPSLITLRALMLLNVEAGVHNFYRPASSVIPWGHRSWFPGWCPNSLAINYGQMWLWRLLWVQAPGLGRRRLWHDGHDGPASPTRLLLTQSMMHVLIVLVFFSYFRFLMTSRAGSSCKSDSTKANCTTCMAWSFAAPSLVACSLSSDAWSASARPKAMGRGGSSSFVLIAPADYIADCSNRFQFGKSTRCANSWWFCLVFVKPGLAGPCRTLPTATCCRTLSHIVTHCTQNDK